MELLGPTWILAQGMWDGVFDVVCVCMCVLHSWAYAGNKLGLKF